MNLENKEVQRDLNQQIKEVGWSQEIQDEYDRFVQGVKERERKYYTDLAAVKEESHWRLRKTGDVTLPGDEEIIERYNAKFSEIPQLKKEDGHVDDYDFDFPVDLKNYNPWDEYRMIYKDVLTKGRKYWILQSIPDWYFLQEYRQESETYNGVSFFDPVRVNTNDSIFGALEIDKFRESRVVKNNIAVKYNYNIRM